MTPAEPDTISVVRVVIAFAVVFGLLGCFGLGLKYLASRGIRMPAKLAGRTSRLEMVETMTIDMRRRLVIVRCDGREHLLLLGANQDIVVQENLNADSGHS